MRTASRFLAGVLCAYVLGTHVSDVAMWRIRLIASPRTIADDVSFQIPRGPAEYSTTAFVLRARNESAQPLTLTALVDGSERAKATLPPRRDTRIDLASAASGETLTIRSHGAWTLLHAEAANVHGFARGLVNLYVVPATQSVRARRLPILILAAIVFCLAGIPATALARRHRQLQGSLCVLVLILFAAVAVSQAVSPYRIILSPRTFGLALLILFWRRVLTFGRWATDRLRDRPIAGAATTAAIASLFFASALLQTLQTFNGNYSGFLHLSREYVASLPYLKEWPRLRDALIVHDAGYDGQFVYGMAFDPTLTTYRSEPERYDAVADAPPYRYGRIGLSALTSLVAGHRPERFPATTMWLVVLGHVLLAFALATFASDCGRHPLLALGYLAIPGFMPSLLFGLPEVFAAAGLVAGIVLWNRSRLLWAAVCFGLAGLFRETVLVVPAALMAVAGWRDRDVRAITTFGACVLPVLAWRTFVWSRLASVYGLRAFYYDPGDLGIPLAGLWHLVRASWAGAHPAPERMAAFVFPAVLVTLWILSLYSLRRRDGLAVAAAVYGTIAVSLNYQQIWSHVPSGERGTYELFLCLFLIGLSERQAAPRRVFALALSICAAYTFIASPEAATSRAALLILR